MLPRVVTRNFSMTRARYCAAHCSADSFSHVKHVTLSPSQPGGYLPLAWILFGTAADLMDGSVGNTRSRIMLRVSWNSATCDIVWLSKVWCEGALSFEYRLKEKCWNFSHLGRAPCIPILLLCDVMTCYMWWNMGWDILMSSAWF